MDKSLKPAISWADFKKSNRHRGACAVCISPLRKEIERALADKYGASFVCRWLAHAYPDNGLTRSMIENHLRASHANSNK